MLTTKSVFHLRRLLTGIKITRFLNTLSIVVKDYIYKLEWDEVGPEADVFPIP